MEKKILEIESVKIIYNKLKKFQNNKKIEQLQFYSIF